ncbi:RPM1-interacting protein 4-like [Arachis stenosperma]|uniref:RPM1-interacting protein 4-like n=1 Tax=Arachis stenosperma TaxID=217475 RepID=UPI0025AD064E|nr:RPM1-interacting protein 4-like [Arachis stenosperma]
MTHAHVPRFGNWDADNVPYSAYFDNARRQNSITKAKDSEVVFNKNNDDVDASRASSRNRSRSNRRRHREGRSNSSRRQLHHRTRMTTQEASEINNFDHSVMTKLNLGTHHGGNDNNSAPFSPPRRQIKRRDSTTIGHPFQHANKEGTLVPEFGAWDATDAKSAQGYTAIFWKIRQEKLTAKRRKHFPNNNAQSMNNNIQNQCSSSSSSRFSKIMKQCCCCLISHETK